MKNRQLLLNWLEAIKYDETFELTQNTVICSAHFLSSDYVVENGTYELSDTAVPKLLYEPKVVDRPLLPKTPIILEVRGGYDLNSGCVGPNVSSYKGGGFTNTPNMMESGIETCSNNIGLQQCQEDNLRISHLNEMSSKINSHFVNDGASTSFMKLPNPTLNPKLRRKNNARTSNHSYPMMNSLSSSSASTSFMHSPNSVLNSTNKLKYVRNYSGHTKSLIKKSSICQNKDKFFWFSIDPSLICECSNYNKCCKKLMEIKAQNRILRRKIKNMATRRRDVLDFKVKYLELKQNVTDTEEQLLSCGIETKKYSAFRMASGSHEIPINVDYDVLLECKLDEINLNSNNHSPTLQSDELPIIVQTSPKSES